jgi:hypothetical protein
VVRVRDAFADIGITDPELDKLYPHPNTYAKLETLAASSRWQIGDRVPTELRAPPESPTPDEPRRGFWQRIFGG